MCVHHSSSHLSWSWVYQYYIVSLALHSSVSNTSTLGSWLACPCWCLWSLWAGINWTWNQFLGLLALCRPHRTCLGTFTRTRKNSVSTWQLLKCQNGEILMQKLIRGMMGLSILPFLVVLCISLWRGRRGWKTSHARGKQRCRYGLDSRLWRIFQKLIKLRYGWIKVLHILDLTPF